MCHFGSLPFSFFRCGCLCRFVLCVFRSRFCLFDLHKTVVLNYTARLCNFSLKLVQTKFSQLIRCFVSLKVFYAVLKTFLDNLQVLLCNSCFFISVYYKNLV